MVAGWLAVARSNLATAVILTVLVGVVATVNLIGPYLVMLLGFVVAPTSRRFPTLLAARRLVDDPRSTWRAVSAIGLGVIVAGLSTMVAGSGDAGGPEGYEFLGPDMATGAYLTLAIIAVVSATSTGVVQAARVLDQREQYRALALAGAGEGSPPCGADPRGGVAPGGDRAGGGGDDGRADGPVRPADRAGWWRGSSWRCSRRWP